MVRLAWWAMAAVLYGPGASLAVAQAALPQRAVLRAAELRFDARATAGDFSGRTAEATGAFAGRADDGTLRGHVEFAPATLRTGNDGRDRHLRESLEVETYPTVRFDVARVHVDGSAGDTVLATLVGTITAHGVTRDREVAARVLAGPDGTRVLASFPMSFREFGIRRHLSKFLGVVKVSDAFTVHVDLTFAGAS